MLRITKRKRKNTESIFIENKFNKNAQATKTA
jgi:hypothetical protein